MGDDDINEIYLELLKKQFCEALGLRKFDDNSKKYLEGLKEFIVLRQALGRKYNKFLRMLGLNITTRLNVELDKGNADSIVKNFNTSVVTPYPIDVPKDRIYSFEDVRANRILTQNPYFKENIKEMANYYNEDGYDILFGVYGKKFDKDMHRKMQQILTLTKKIKDYNYKTGILKDNNNYFGVVYTTANETERQLDDMKKDIESDILYGGKTR